MSAHDLKSTLAPFAVQRHRDRAQAADDTARLELWLALPEGAAHFDADRLGEAQRQQLARLKSQAKRQDFVVSRALQQHVGPRSNQSFTHSAGYAAIACAPPGCRVGVDLERHRNRDVASLADFAFSEQEHAALMSLVRGKTERFYTLWVMKEALAKALQIPLLEALRQCIFAEDAHGRWHASAPTTRPWRVRAFTPCEGLSLAVAVVGNDLPTTLKTFEWPTARQGCWKATVTVVGR